MIWTKVSLLISGFLILLSTQGLALEQADVQVETKSLKDATHIEFSGRDEWRYDLSHGQNKISVQFTGLKPDDIVELTDLKDARVKSVTVKEGINGDALVTFTLSAGLNLFDYQTDRPVHLVFDIFKEEKKPKKIVKTARAAKKPVKAGNSDIFSKRNVASVDHPEIGAQPLLNSSSDSRLDLKYGIFDGGDATMSRFKILDGDLIPGAQEVAMIKSTHNLYVHFPALTLERPFLKNMVNDGAMKYESPTGTNDETLQVKLIIKLFNEEKYAVVLRTLKFFREKYPKSEFDKILDFLVADTYFRLWQRDHDRTDFETAMTRYKELLNKYPTDGSRHHTLMFIGLNYLQTGNYLGALSTFQVGIQKYPESPFIWEMRLAEADVLNQLNKGPASLAKLDEIKNDPKAGSFAAEAGVRRGDVFFRMKDYASAIKEYKDAIQKYPHNLNDSPNLFFNTAESQFWLKDYKGSLDTFRDFLQRFPNHPYGGLAMTRIGEIFDMMGVNSKKVTGAFLESYYRFRGSAGAFIAKLYVNVARYGKMKDKEVENVKAEITDELPKYSSIEEMDPFVTLQLSKGIRDRGQFDEAFDRLTKYYQKYVLSPHLPLFKENIVATITDKMRAQREKEDSLKTVETYIANRDSWLKGNKRIDTSYVLGQAYEGLNLSDEAIRAYTTALTNLKGLSGDELKDHMILEHVPSSDEINLRLAQTSLKDENLKKAAQYLAEIKTPETLSESEKVERALILSGLAEKEERTDLALLALKDLNEHWKGRTDLLADAWLRMGRLEVKAENYAGALPWVVKIMSASTGANEQIKDDTVREAIELAGDIHTHLGQTKQAVDSYKMYLEKFGQNSPTAAVKYKLGKIYFDQRDLRSATQVWDDLKADDKAKVWAKMAEENLSQANWDAKYNRYLDRAPAQTTTPPGGTK